mmetsp:Transcript_52189/g.124322  ORF Transcript_52189/g.124322 Transcript_52189/m.124322 type:complete len:308 (+) Transcript_52189:188-1111(+)
MAAWVSLPADSCDTASVRKMSISSRPARSAKSAGVSFSPFASPGGTAACSTRKMTMGRRLAATAACSGVLPCSRAPFKSPPWRRMWASASSSPSSTALKMRGESTSRCASIISFSWEGKTSAQKGHLKRRRTHCASCSARFAGGTASPQLEHAEPYAEAEATGLFAAWGGRGMAPLMPELVISCSATRGGSLLRALLRRTMRMETSEWCRFVATSNGVSSMALRASPLAPLSMSRLTTSSLPLRAATCSSESANLSRTFTSPPWLRKLRRCPQSPSPAAANAPSESRAAARWASFSLAGITSLHASQ